MIEFTEATRRFGRGSRSVAALEGITLAVAAGEVTAVVGPNGAGKSTLFALALGFLAPTAGRVTIDGADPRAWVRAHGAGYLSDRFSIPRDWPVGRALRALARLDGRAAVDTSAVLDRFALGDVRHREIGTLSRGTLQRVGLAQAALAPRRLMVLDEPAQGLDPLWRIRLRTWIGELRAAGTTVLLASHDLAEVEQVADRVVLLDRGRVREMLEPRASTPQAWRLTLADASERVADAFPGARRIDDHAYLVTAADAADLSARLAALIGSGATITAVEPASEALEARVRRALEADGG